MNLIIRHLEGTKWFDQSAVDDSTDINKEVAASDSNEISAENLKELEDKADELLRIDTEHFEAYYRTKYSSKVKWFEEVSRVGTFADRMSVVQVRVQISPIHSLSYVKTLVDSIHKKNLRESNSTLLMLKELFLRDLLPDRKLIKFSQRPLKNCVKILQHNKNKSKYEEIERRLILWKYESNLKDCYSMFVHSLESLAGNVVVGISENSCALILELLSECPEQEQFLLSALVNKLGHLSRKVASQVANLLNKLVEKHFNMRKIVVNEIGNLLFRKNVSERAQYYAIHFLNHIYLRTGETELAFTLIKSYFNLFKIVVTKANHEHSLIPLLITGVNRAIPYVSSLEWEKSGMLSEEVDNLYGLVQTTKFSISLNVLKLLFNVHNRSDGLPDRFYSSFYRRLFSVTSSSSLNSQFFAFFLKVVKNDSVDTRVRAFLKRLFQIALSSTAPEFAAAALLIAEMIIKNRPHLLHFTQLGNNLSETDWVSKYRVYDMNARNPLFANADIALDVELIIFAEHYHPSVAIFAQKLISGEPINYDGDPLENFNPLNFLERFALKNPKRKNEGKHCEDSEMS